MNYNLQDYWITILHVKLEQYCKETTLHFLKRNVWIISPLWVIALSCWRGLCNSMKLWAMLCRTIQDGWAIAESSDKKWYTGGRNGKPPQYTCYENLMNCIKRQKDMTSKDESSRSWHHYSSLSLLFNYPAHL